MPIKKRMKSGSWAISPQTDTGLFARRPAPATFLTALPRDTVSKTEQPPFDGLVAHQLDGQVDFAVKKGQAVSEDQRR